MLATEPLLKVTSFVTRMGSDGRAEVVLIDHPHGGIQFPAGTIEEGEHPLAAAKREAWEETGLSDFGNPLAAGERSVDMSPNAAILRTTPVFTRPSAASEAMATLRNGLAVSIAREQGSFAQVTYRTHDDVERRVLSFQITGWAPCDAITHQVRRFFFVLPFTGSAPPSWMHRADHHDWRLFWAPVSDLPPIVPAQAYWADYLRAAL
jgi:8-oxo-dGTP pyrophosphatase MutT (NUDIX family)